MRLSSTFGCLLVTLAFAGANAQPVPVPDGLPIGAAAEHGVDAARLESFRAWLRSPEAAALRSVLLVRNDKLVFEHYAPGFDAGTPQQLNSVTKSVLSALVGIALERKLIASLDQTVGELLPQAAAADPRVRGIPLRALLSLTAGFDWDERERDNCRRTLGADCSRFLSGTDLVAFAVRRAVGDEPGARFRYDSYASHLISAILTRATGMSAARFAQQELAVPLGITQIRWPGDAQGHSYGGWGLQATPRDLARFGLLYLHRGVWQGKQLVPAAWVEESTRRHTAGGWPLGPWAGYGYHWWVIALRGGIPAYAAIGSGGQALYVLPSLDAVLVITTDPSNTADVFSPVLGSLIPAITPAR